MTFDFSFLVWFVPALLSSSVLGGALVQVMIHRTRRHVTQNIADLAEAAVKVGDKAVIQQIADLISGEAAAQAPKQINRQRRYEVSIIVLAMSLILAIGGTVGVIIYVDDALKAGTMKSEQADVIWQGSLIGATIIILASYLNFVYSQHKKSVENTQLAEKTSQDPAI